MVWHSLLSWGKPSGPARVSPLRLHPPRLHGRPDRAENSWCESPPGHGAERLILEIETKPFIIACGCLHFIPAHPSHAFRPHVRYRPGHETYPVFQQAEPLRVVANAMRWLSIK